MDYEEHNQSIFEETGFWGEQGAGAILFSPERGKFGLGLRSEAVLEPGTIGTFGGAIDGGISPEEAVAQELMEELGYVMPLTLRKVFVFEKDSFKYHNFVAIIDDQYFEPILNWENDEVVWMSLEEMQSNDNLHYGMESILNNEKAVKMLSLIEDSSAKLDSVNNDSDGFSY